MAGTLFAQSDVDPFDELTQAFLDQRRHHAFDDIQTS